MTIIFVAAAAGALVLYLLRRRSRLNASDE
jgi:hypothetical protein